MPEQQYDMTQETYDSLKEQLDELIKVRRPEIIERIKEARGHGDLSENAEYDAAREEQRSNEGKIAELEYKIKNANIIEAPKDNKEVGINSIVRALDTELDEEVEYTITSVTDYDVEHNKISAQSPVGAALLGHKVRDEVTVPCPNGSSYVLKIREIRILSVVTVVDRETGEERAEYTITSDENYEGMNSKIYSGSTLAEILSQCSEGDVIKVPAVKKKSKGDSAEDSKTKAEEEAETDVPEDAEKEDGTPAEDTSEAYAESPKGKAKGKKGAKAEVKIRIKSISHAGE